MLKRKTLGSQAFDVINIILLLLIVISTLYPMYYVLMASVSDPMLVSNYNGLLLAPKGFTLEPYKQVIQNANIWRGYGNTLIYLILGTTINMLMTCMGAYILSRKTFKWRNQFMFLIVITMYFQGGLIPLYMVVRNLGMIDTVWAMVIPVAMATWNLIIMRTGFQLLPDELEESAKMDGANDFTVLFKIVIPLSMPVIAAVGLFYGVSHWNSWFNAVIYLRSRELYPLQLILREILILNTNDNPVFSSSDMDANQLKLVMKYAVIVVSTLPILCVYPFLQRFFIKGVMIGAIKG